jgi:hypothetical protein
MSEYLPHIAYLDAVMDGMCERECAPYDVAVSSSDAHEPTKYIELMWYSGEATGGTWPDGMMCVTWHSYAGWHVGEPGGELARLPIPVNAAPAAVAETVRWLCDRGPGRTPPVRTEEWDPSVVGGEAGRAEEPFTAGPETDAGYPPALLWARLLDEADLSAFLLDLTAAALDSYRPGTVGAQTLASMEQAIAVRRLNAEIGHAQATAPGPHAAERGEGR